jgi:hypothetical protein
MCLPEPIECDRNSRVAGLLEIRRDTAMMNKRAGEICDGTGILCLGRLCLHVGTWQLMTQATGNVWFCN